MNHGWHLGGVWYDHVATLATRPGGISWYLARQGAQGPRFLLQHWEPAPLDREQDQLKHEYLAQIQSAQPGDPLRTRFDSEEGRLWLLQELRGESLASLWPALRGDQRSSLLRDLERSLENRDFPRFLHPEVVGWVSGRFCLPKVLGISPSTLPDLKASLTALPERDPEREMIHLPAAPELPIEEPTPIRGRGQELTYLKSLMFGLRTGSNIERVVVIQGEEGLGKDKLATLAAAAAETEGFWILDQPLLPEEGAGHFLGALLQNLLQGTEAEFYATHPESARILSAHMESFAFLGGGRRRGMGLPEVEAQELEAALVLLHFVHDRHPRLIMVKGIDRADTDLLGLFKELIRKSKLPWLITANNGGPTRTARPLLGPLSQDPDVAILNLRRLQDDILRETVDDLLSPHHLPEDLAQAICRAALGNAGLLRHLLERAQLEGTLVWESEGWSPAPDRTISLKVNPTLLADIFSGRLRRLPAPALLMARLVALGDESLSLETLGRAVGLAGDPLEEAFHTLQSGRFISILDGQVFPASPESREMVLEGTSPGEIKRLARLLLKALEEVSGRPVLSVRLQSFASDASTALSRVMEAIDQAPPSPHEAERIVNQTLALGPTPTQRARLWEFLADAWTRSTLRARYHPTLLKGRSPYEWALESLEKAIREHEGEEGLSPCTKARTLRKKAFLELRLRRAEDAERTARTAQDLLMDHLFHEEQTRLRLALGRSSYFQGHLPKAARHIEEGRHLVERVEQRKSLPEQAGLLLDLGRIQSDRCQFQGALESLESACRILEQDQDHRRLVAVLLTLSTLRLNAGQPDLSRLALEDADRAARVQDDLELIAECHLAAGIQASHGQALDQAQKHLDKSYDLFIKLADRSMANRVILWKARTLAALGNFVDSEHLLLPLASSQTPCSAEEKGECLFLHGEILGFQGAWTQAGREYLEAADWNQRYGLVWRERLAQLRAVQTMGHKEQCGDPGDRETAWGLLEDLKNPIESSGSRWLELEWHYAHALLQSCGGLGDTQTSRTLESWGVVLGLARELGRPDLVLEASAQGARLLLGQGEKLGARAKLQEAFAPFQTLWSHIPEASEQAFLGRSDLHQFRQAVTAAGLRFILPERLGSGELTPTHLPRKERSQLRDFT